MSLPPRTPVLVGVAAVSQREEDPARAAEPVALMHRALEQAAEDAGSRALLARADSIRVPRGLWEYPDPARLLADALGARRARTWLAQVGVLQTTLVGGAARDIAAGREDVVLVAGGEAHYRTQRARAAGGEAPLTRQPDGVAPDVELRPDGPILMMEEVRAGLGMPASQYAMLENALRAAEGLSLDAHRTAVAELWAGMSRVAEGNPDAWSRKPLDAAAIRDPGEGNRMIAFPYTKRLCSQWNVDQAAGLVLCSAATAASLGIPRERWVLPRAVVESNHMRSFSARRSLHRSPGFALAGERALDHAGVGADELDHLELYSCFPSAVRVQMRELGIAGERPVTVTGGMAFAGGPLNNFVLQALVPMARRLREEPGSTGLVTAVSGLLTKQGVSVWSAEPGPEPYLFDDVGAAAAAAEEEVAVVADARGTARIASYTVLPDAPHTVVLADLDDGRRALASSGDPDLAERALGEELCGRSVRLTDDGIHLDDEP